MAGRLWLLTVALLGGWASGLPVFAVFVGAYVLAWATRTYLLHAGGKAARPWVAGLALLAAAAGASTAAPTIFETEQLSGITGVFLDRWRLQRLPILAPAVVASDRPQRFYVWAPDANHAALSFGERKIAADAVGAGLFVVDYDPRRDGPPTSIADVTIDGETHQRMFEVYTSSPHPRWACHGHDGVAVVSEESDEIVRVDRSGITKLETADGPTDCAVLADGRLAITHRYANHVRIGDVDVDVGAGQVRVDAVGDRLSVLIERPPTLVEVSTSSATVLRRRSLPHPPDWIAHDHEGRAIVSSREKHRIWRVGEPNAPIRFGRPPITMATSPSGRRLFIALTDYRPDGDPGANHAIEEQIVVVDLERWRIEKRLPTAALGATPTGLFAPAEDRVYVAFAGDDRVASLGLDGTSAVWPATVVAPHGIAPLGDHLVVTSPVEGAIVVLDDGRSIARHTLAPPMDADPVRRGERAFYEATKSGLSCATCHLHGGSDFALHDIGHDKPRPTLDIRGIAKTSPYLRGASYATLDALHDFGVGVLGGWTREVPDRADLLASYVEHQPRIATPRVPAASLRTGFEVFVRAGCAACHQPGAFTDLSQVPSTALFPERDAATALDTPSLIDVGVTAPYLHDGRAPSIRAVLIDHNQSGRHGAADQLSSDELEALVAFVEAL